MKKTILFLLVAGTLTGCGTKNEATIEGTVTGLDDDAKVYLLDSDQEKVDSTVTAGGAFRFDLKKAYPDRAFLLFDGVKQPFSFIREPGMIVVQADFGAENKVIVAGTDSNDRIKTLNEGLAGYIERMKELGPKLSALESDEPSPEFDSLLTIYRETSAEYRQFTDKSIQENTNTIFAAYLLNSNAHAMGTPAKMDSVLNLVAEAPANAFTDRMKERREILAKTEVGQPAPDFTQNQPDGTPFTLSSLKGKVVLIDFWASWCGPCRAANPGVVKVYEQFKENGFEIVGVSLDRTREDWLKGIEEDSLTWIHVSDLEFWNNAVAKQYAVRSIPHTVLLDKNGVIVAKNLHGEELVKKVSEALGI